MRSPFVALRVADGHIHDQLAAESAFDSLPPLKRHARGAFTMIELLVVITIILILSTISIAAFNYSLGADRVRSAARQFQSFLAGARDKAIFANDIRGVRLLLSPVDNHTVSAMQYVGSPQQDTGTLSLYSLDSTNHTVQLPLSSPSAYPGRWTILRNRGFLRLGCRIQIPATTGSWYTVSAIVPNMETNPSPPPALVPAEPLLVLDQPVLSIASSSTLVSYVMELAPGVLGDAQPVLFPSGVVIDLDGSQVPTSWVPPIITGTTTGGWSPTTGLSMPYGSQPGTPGQMDILFSPRGTVVGDCAGLGMVHLHFADAGDVTRWHSIAGRNSATWAVPVVPADNLSTSPQTIVVTRDRILATLVPKTGNVGVYYVNPTNTSATGVVADDAYSYAETGQVANR